MLSPLGLATYRWNNNIKSMLLLGAFPLLLVGLLWAFFLILGWSSSDVFGNIDPMLVEFVHLKPSNGKTTLFALASAGTAAFWPYAAGIAGVWLIIGFIFHDGLIRMATTARHVERREAPELYNLLENLCISRGIAMPKLEIIDTSIKNAYASGLTKGSYSITVTRGLLEALDKDELEAVLAHELSHIMNRDVRLLVISVLFGGMLSFFAEMMWRNMHFTPSSSDRTDGRGALFATLIAAALLSVGYLIALLLRFALSRRREYLADAGSVALTKNPDALIRALQKISGNASMPSVPSGVQAMMIENPPGLFDIFDTHPPVEARIAVLRRLGNQPDERKSIIPNT